MINITGAGGGFGGVAGGESTNRKVVPEARAALDKMKFEVATQIGVNLKEGYNGDLTARDAGYVGGFMTRKLIEMAERQLIGR